MGAVPLGIPPTLQTVTPSEGLAMFKGLKSGNCDFRSQRLFSTFQYNFHIYPILLPFKSVLHIFMVSPPLCLTLPLQNSLSPLLASFPPPHFSIIIYPCWPVNLSDPWLPKSPQCIPHQTLTACRHDPLLDTQWVDSHLHSLNQTASELQLVEGEGGAHSPS